MTTLATMIAEIVSDTGRSGTTQQTAMSAKIYAAIRKYQKTRFWFNETRDVTFSTVIGQSVYTFNTATTSGDIDAEFYAIDGVFVTYATGDVREIDLGYYDWLEVPADSVTGNGQPCEAAYINRALRFNIGFDAVYSVRLTGHIKLAAPAAPDEEDNPWMTEAYDLIMSRAKAELYAHRWEDPGNAQLMVQAEKSALNALMSATYDKTATGSVVASEF